MNVITACSMSVWLPLIHVLKRIGLSSSAERFTGTDVSVSFAIVRLISQSDNDEILDGSGSCGAMP